MIVTIVFEGLSSGTPARRYLREHEEHCNQGGPFGDAPKEMR